MKLAKLAKGLRKLADTTPSKSVGYLGDEATQKVTPLNVLEDNTDEFVALVQSLPDNAEILETIEKLDNSSQHVEKYLNKIALELTKILEPGNDSKEVAKIKATSGLNSLADILQQYSKEFSDLQSLSSMLKKLSTKNKKEEKHKPVKHKLPDDKSFKLPKPDLKEDSLEDLMKPKNTDKSKESK